MLNSTKHTNTQNTDIYSLVFEPGSAYIYQRVIELKCQAPASTTSTATASAPRFRATRCTIHFLRQGASIDFQSPHVLVTSCDHQPILPCFGQIVLPTKSRYPHATGESSNPNQFSVSRTSTLPLPGPGLPPSALHPKRSQRTITTWDRLAQIRSITTTLAELPQSVAFFRYIKVRNKNAER